jgi:hypothetical protein
MSLNFTETLLRHAWTSSGLCTKVINRSTSIPLQKSRTNKAPALLLHQLFQELWLCLELARMLRRNWRSIDSVKESFLFNPTLNWIRGLFLCCSRDSPQRGWTFQDCPQWMCTKLLHVSSRVYREIGRHINGTYLSYCNCPAGVFHVLPVLAARHARPSTARACPKGIYKMKIWELRRHNARDLSPARRVLHSVGAALNVCPSCSTLVCPSLPHRKNLRDRDTRAVRRTWGSQQAATSRPVFCGRDLSHWASHADSPSWFFSSALPCPPTARPACLSSNHRKRTDSSRRSSKLDSTLP